jgi:hypothetical protein
MPRKYLPISNHALNSRTSGHTFCGVNATKREISQSSSIKQWKPTHILCVHATKSPLVTTYQVLRGALLPPTLSTSPRDRNSVDPKVGDAYSHAMCSMPPKVVQRAISHQILRDVNSPPALQIPPEVVSQNSHALNGGRSRLTYCVPNGITKCISQLPCIKLSDLD